MKASKSESLQARASRLLKLAGILLILSALVDYILLPIPLQWGDPQWQLRISTKIVERGVVPLMGMAFIIGGYGFDKSSETNPSTAHNQWQDLHFWSAVVSSFLGLVFLLLVPIHIGNVLAARGATVERIDRETTQAKQQLEQSLQQRQQDLEALLANPQELKTYIENNNLSPEKQSRLQNFQNHPEALQQQTQTVRNLMEEQIEQRRLTALKDSKVGAFKSSVRIGLESLLLASGYVVIGWTGLKRYK
ncbi:HpsJ family protein [Geitlerinema sp. PCC 9228]|jgi:hypothetical protein|uniref:HpsJ family protein n=1 Tax=Geitlerinema sp. PCC 9228 TaxID=111611 RepID=UPI0008F9DABC|nr:HpsJ family protein [Geitlerinema sp. PCC 9228]